MSASAAPVQVAILDDYQNIALQMADWSRLAHRAVITVFNDHVADPAALVERLQRFDVVCVMRERTPLPRAISGTGYTSSPTIELTWALILAAARNVVAENTALRHGGWQQSLGEDLDGKVLAVLGLGRIGSRVAAIGRAFGMEVIAWSQNLTGDKAEAAGARLVTKQELFRDADFLTIHLVLSRRTAGLVGTAELALMKHSAKLINTSRGPIVDEAALISALRERRIAGAALDVHGIEPLPTDHPYRSLDNVLATPHIGYVSRRLYETFYRDTVDNILAWLDGRPIRLSADPRAATAKSPRR